MDSSILESVRLILISSYYGNVILSTVLPVGNVAYVFSEFLYVFNRIAGNLFCSWVIPFGIM